ncbi:blue copper protein 1b-like [Wolffia australiana]
MASPIKVFATLASMALLLEYAFAATIVVGAPNGSWDLRTDYRSWASSQTFSVGDTLGSLLADKVYFISFFVVFQYTSFHDVVEVTEADFDACRSTNPIARYTDGNTVVSLPSTGKRFFICGIAGHCSEGMKVEVDVVSDAAPASPPSSPMTPPPVVSSSPAPSPSASSPATPPPVVRSAPAPSMTPSPGSNAAPSPTRSAPPPSNSAAHGFMSPALAGILAVMTIFMAV